MEDGASAGIGVEEMNRLGDSPGDRAEERKLPDYVFKQTTESFQLTDEIHHPFIPALELAQGRAVESIGDDSGAAVGAAAGDITDAGQRLPEDLFRVLGRGFPLSEVSSAEDAGSVGEVDRQADDLAVAPPGGELEEERVADFFLRLQPRFLVLRLQEGSSEFATGYAWNADLLQESSELWVFNGGEWNCATALVNPLGEKRRSGLNLVFTQRGAKRSFWTLQPVHAVF